MTVYRMHTLRKRGGKLTAICSFTILHYELLDRKGIHGSIASCKARNSRFLAALIPKGCTLAATHNQAGSQANR